MKLTAEKLFKMLLKKDKRRAKSIDKQNKQRLIRALEIVAALGKVPEIQKNKEEKNYEVFWLGLKPNKETLKTKIKRRLNLRLKKGMIIEARKLHKIGLSWKRMKELGLEYRYLALYLQKKISKQEMINKLETKIWQYAKRQMTWFKRNKKIFWIDPDNQAQKKIAFKMIKSWLNK
jgi:tRNA dimethylallyltransferase